MHKKLREERGYMSGGAAYEKQKHIKSTG